MMPKMEVEIADNGIIVTDKMGKTVWRFNSFDEVVPDGKPKLYLWQDEANYQLYDYDNGDLGLEVEVRLSVIRRKKLK